MTAVIFKGRTSFVFHRMRYDVHHKQKKMISLNFKDMHLPVNDLQNFNFLNDLSTDKKNLALSEAEVVIYKRHQIIFAQNDPVEYFGIVLEGLVAISKTVFSRVQVAEKPSETNETDKKQIIDIIPQHEFFGGLLILNHITRYPVSVSCLSTKAKIILISKEFFQKTWLPDTDLYSLFQRNVFNRVQSMQNLKEIQAISTEDKLKNALRFIYKKQLFIQSADSSKDNLIELDLTRKQLGEICNTTTETTIRIFAQWQKADLVFTEAGREYMRPQLLA